MGEHPYMATVSDHSLHSCKSCCRLDCLRSQLVLLGPDLGSALCDLVGHWPPKEVVEQVVVLLVLQKRELEGLLLGDSIRLHHTYGKVFPKTVRPRCRTTEKKQRKRRAKRRSGRIF